MTNKKYQIILADPPWNYQDQGCQGTMANHYVGMYLKDIKALPINQIADKNCILFLWATYPMLKEALEVIEAWGFKYKTIAFQWIKLNKRGKGYFFGLGRWTRGNTECCLLATKGKPKRKSAKVSQIIEAPLTKHSQKPEIVRDKIIELVGDLPRIELFARKPKDELFEDESFKGWDVIGNEIDGQDIRKTIENMIK